MIYTVFRLDQVNNLNLLINNDRVYCKNIFKNDPRRQKGCITFYNRIIDGGDDKVQHFKCKHHFHVFYYGGYVLSGILIEDRNKNKIIDRNKLSKLKDNTSYFPTRDFFLFEEYIVYYASFQQLKEMIHDISNSLGNIVEILRAGFKNNNDIDMLNSMISKYIDINDSVSFIRNLEIQPLCNNDIDAFDSDQQLEKFRKLNKDIKTRVEAILTQITEHENWANERKRNLPQQEIPYESFLAIEGFGLIRTIIEYHLKRDKISPLEIDFKPINPHRGLVKLKKLLEFKAKMRDIKIQFNTKHSEIKEINTTSDIYIVLFTLLDNAIKYTTRGGTIQLEYHVNADSVLIKISNPYTNLDNIDFNRLYERGYRPKDNVNSGSGYGLYLVKRILDKCNSTISILRIKKRFVVELLICDNH